MKQSLPDSLATVLRDTLGGESPPLVVAFSGGRDSTVLLHALNRLAIYPLSAVHVNHQLQSASSDWAAHCVSQCRDWDVPCEVVTVQVSRDSGEGTEAAARRARYTALQSRLLSGAVLVTAHHQGDQAETLLLQLLRGAGLDGLAAMPKCKPFGLGRHLRPLLDVSPQQIADYAAEHGLRWVDDPSNVNTHYDRNYLRHEIIPRLQARWPAMEETLSRSAGHLAEAATLLEATLAPQLDRICDESGQLRLVELRKLDPAEINSLLRLWLNAHCGLVASSAQLGQIRQQFLLSSLDAQPLFSMQGAELRRFRDVLYCLPPLPAWDAGQVLRWDGLSSLRVEGVGEVKVTSEVGAGVSQRRLQQAVRVELRFRQGGESIVLPGRGRHNLKKLLQDADVPPWQRERTPLLYLDHELAAVIGRWVSADFCAELDEVGLVYVLTTPF